MPSTCQRVAAEGRSPTPHARVAVALSRSQIDRRNPGGRHLPNPRGPQASPAWKRLSSPSPPSGSLPVWSMPHRPLAISKPLFSSGWDPIEPTKSINLHKWPLPQAQKSKKYVRVEDMACGEEEL
uniref:Uncharacterized protein n=1 Tax=Aegilops tauschii subsp. strangulata TaxID=200361 RepID=A0A453EJA8_AEGTS